jgi:hypothetical protein
MLRRANWFKGDVSMYSDSSSKSKQWSLSSILSFLGISKDWNRQAIIPVAILLIVILFMALSIWNSRYQAGYKAGAGEGAVYKPLYEEFQAENQTLRKQHDQDINEISQFKKRIGQLEGKQGLFKPNVTQNQAEETLERANEIQRQTEQLRAETLEKSIEIGKTFGRLEELEKQNQKLSNDLNNAQSGLRVREVIIFVLLIFGCLFAWFSARRNAQTPVQPFYRSPNTVSTSAIDVGNAKPKFLEENNTSQTTLPAGEDEESPDI